MVLHLREDLNPLIKVFWLEVHLSASVKDFDMGPFKAVETTILNSFLEGLGHKQRIPFFRGTVCAVLFSVDSRHINFFLCSWDRVEVKSAGSNILRAAQQNVEIGGCELGIQVHNLCQVNKANFNCSFGCMRSEDSVDYLKEDRLILFDHLFGNCDFTKDCIRAATSSSSCDASRANMLALESIVACS